MGISAATWLHTCQNAAEIRVAWQGTQQCQAAPTGQQQSHTQWLELAPHTWSQEGGQLVCCMRYGLEYLGPLIRCVSGYGMTQEKEKWKNSQMMLD